MLMAGVNEDGKIPANHIAVAIVFLHRFPGIRIKIGVEFHKISIARIFKIGFTTEGTEITEPQIESSFIPLPRPRGRGKGEGAFPEKKINKI
jgi:hypothetical protein